MYVMVVVHYVGTVEVRHEVIREAPLRSGASKARMPDGDP